MKKAGKPASVLMSYEEFESLASLNLSINEQLMADPHFQRKLRLSEEQLKSGRVLKHAQVKQKFARRKR